MPDPVETGAKPPLRIGVIVSSMGPGGAERAMAILTDCWARRGWPVTIYSFDDENVAPFHAPHPDVALKPLGLRRDSGSVASAIANNLRRISRYTRSNRVFYVPFDKLSEQFKRIHREGGKIASITPVT